jgi:hypothetical protein
MVFMLLSTDTLEQLDTSRFQLNTRTHACQVK